MKKNIARTGATVVLLLALMALVTFSDVWKLFS